MLWWNTFVREELSPVLNNIKVTAPLEYIMRVSKVVEKLQRLCRELFADHLVSVAELLGEVGIILKENGKAECVKVRQLQLIVLMWFIWDMRTWVILYSGAWRYNFMRLLVLSITCLTHKYLFSVGVYFPSPVVLCQSQFCPPHLPQGSSEGP